MRRSSVLSTLLALCALLVAASPAAAASRLTASRLDVRGGDRVAIQWDGLAPGIREVELELSLDGGRWIRVSPELDPNDGRFEWTVPAGLAGEARLRLRTGRDHDESVEAMLALRLHSDAAPSPGLTSDDWWALDRHAAPDAAMRESDAWRAGDAPITLAHDAPQVLLSAPTRTEVSLAPASESRTLAPDTRRFIAPRRAPLRN